MLHEAGSSGDFNFGDSSRPEAEFQTDRPHEMEETVIQTNVRSFCTGSTVVTSYRGL